MITPELQEFFRFRRHDAPLGGPSDGHSTATAEIQKSFLAKYPESAKNRVRVHTESRREISRGRQPFTRLCLTLGDRATDGRGNLLMQGTWIACLNLDDRHRAGNTSTMTTFLLAQRPFGRIATDQKSAAAVIADARQRQRRRRAIVGATVATTGIALLGLLAFHDFVLAHHAPVRQTSVRVYLSAQATPRQTARLLAAARAEHGIANATVYSKRAALEALRQQYPALVSHLSGNPLPNAIDLQLTHGIDVSRLIANLKRKQLAGIEQVRYLTQKHGQYITKK